MEDKQSPSMKKLISIHEEKLIKEFDYDTGTSARSTKKQHRLDLEILQKNITNHRRSKSVLVSIKPRNPSIKTLYIAEKSRFYYKKGSERSGSRFAIGDHSSFTSQLIENETNLQTIISKACDLEQTDSRSEVVEISYTPATSNEDAAVTASEFSQVDSSASNVQAYYLNQKSTEKCSIFAQKQTNMNLHNFQQYASTIVGPGKTDIATLIITTTSSDESEAPSLSVITKLTKRIDRLERKILRQEMVYNSRDPKLPISSLNEEYKGKIMRTISASEKPGCSYVDQYSHIPETSAFQRYAQQAAPLSPSKATTLEKEHNSEQYGRDFTTYDGITARGRRQCASVPCKRDGIPKQAAERVQKIRHKLNPVRDYRLMDTVHYLAQGEFAPRDDGIKLTPSREAVLSDIIWEDVCRTHWPNTRLGRRGHSDRCNERCTTRYELQRLIDSLLSERVAHVERRRKRHYRIVKLNHRHENCRVGKTGDIIVASHKNRQGSEDVIVNEENIVGAIPQKKHWKNLNLRRNHRSKERLMVNHVSQNGQPRTDDDSCPGPSYAMRISTSREPTCCYHTSNTTKLEMSTNTVKQTTNYNTNIEITSSSGISGYKSRSKNPRLVVKKETTRRKRESREEVNLDHFVLLPTLVVRTPSNVKRQKKFSELYHRILNNAQKRPVLTKSMDQSSHSNARTKDIGFNINVTLSDSLEQISNSN